MEKFIDTFAGAIFTLFRNRVFLGMLIGFVIALGIFADKDTQWEWIKGTWALVFIPIGILLGHHGWLHVKGAVLGMRTGVEKDDEDITRLSNRIAGLLLGIVFMTLGFGWALGATAGLLERLGIWDVPFLELR